MFTERNDHECKTLSRRAFLKLAAASSSAPRSPGLARCAISPARRNTVELTFGRHWEAAFRPRQAEYDEGFMERHPDIKVSITYNTWADHNNVVPAWAARRHAAGHHLRAWQPRHALGA